MEALIDPQRLGAWVNLVQAESVVAHALEERLQRDVGLSLAEHELLVRLDRAPEGVLRMVDLSGLLLLSKSGVTRMVDRLVQAGHVERRACPSDRRVVYAGITAGGRRLVARAQPVFAAGIQEHFSGHLSDADVRTLRRILRRLLSGNGAWEVERCSLRLEAGTG